jgi:hypothetical protein
MNDKIEILVLVLMYGSILVAGAQFLMFLLKKHEYGFNTSGNIPDLFFSKVTISKKAMKP